jgi:hypothetical protein
MSDTPRTDAATLTEPYQVRELEFEVVDAGEMAILEREINEAKAKIAALESERDQWRMSSVCRELRAELDEANADRLRLLDLLHEAYQPLRQSGNFELSERIRFLVDYGPEAYRNKYKEDKR